MNIDEILVEIGEFGWYQRIRYFLLCLPALIGGFHAMLAVYLTAIPDYRCKLPEWENDTYISDHVDALDAGIPKVYNNDTCQIEYSRCKVYRNGSSEEVDCKSWVFDHSTYKSTVMTEFDLGCDNEKYKSIAQILLMSGVLWGSLLWGTLSDIFGRKRIMPFAVFITFGCGLGAAWAPGIISFMLLRMSVAGNAMGVYIATFVLAIETVGPSARMWAGVCINFFFAGGVMCLPGFAFALRDWRHLQIACSAPMAVFFFYYPILTESPRWLQSKGRHKEALKIMEAIAKGNKKTMPKVELPEDNSKELTPQTTGRIWHMFTSPVLLTRTLIVFWNWAVVTMVFYGLTLRSGNMSGNPYLNLFLSGLVEFPGYILCLLLLNRIGRKKVQAIAMTFGGVAISSTLFPILFGESAGCTGSDLQIVVLVLSLLSKLGMASSFATIYVFSSELFPTVVRNGGMGLCSMAARLGGVISAYVADLDMYVPGKMGQILPQIIFGLCALSAGLLALLLPETLNQNLPETIEDAKQFGRKPTNKIWIETAPAPDSSSSSAGKFVHVNPAFNPDTDPDGAWSYRNGSKSND